MKIAHISDLHGCKEHLEDYKTSMSEFNAYVTRDVPDLIAISGDTYDASMLNTESSGFDIVNGEIQKAANIAPVVMVEGTPSHDVDGSLDVFKRMESRYGITVLQPGKPYFLARHAVEDCIGVIDDVGGLDIPSLLILGIPEPRKKYLLANGTAGKDETEEAVRNAMHQLCFQLAAIRAQYKDLPCLVVYHGDVAGTTLQNNETVERGTGIAITIDELADIGADYYALGHIHKPQQVGTLPAYYAGSIYAKNFGEAHKPGWNLVEIEKAFSTKLPQPTGKMIAHDPAKTFRTYLTRIDFSHLQLFHETVTLEKFDNTNWPSKIKGKIAWVTIKDKPEALIDLNPEYMANEVLVKYYGALPGSKVNLEKIAIETVRAAEIAEASTPEKKLEVWGENSCVGITEGMRAKLKTLEDNAARSVVTASGSWELVSTRVRGFIGIKKGIKRDEIFVDFDSFDDGLIALIGSNGKGKTTFFENCHPYSQLLTRKGKLQGHCFLRDSLREVIYRNPSNGHERRFLIQIDGANKSGTVKGYVFDRSNASSDWQPLPGVDGNMKDYDKAVENFCGPIELFLRTAFTTQKSSKNFPDLTEATEGEKKALFTNLAGIDYLQVFADGAKVEGDKIAASVHDTEVRISTIEGGISNKTDIEQDIKALAGEKLNLTSQVETCKISGTAAKNRLDSLQKAAGAERLRAQKEATLETTMAALEGEIHEINSQIATYEGIASHRGEYEAEIAEYDRLKALLEVETGKQREVEKRNQAKIDAFRAAMDTFNAKKSEIEQELARAKDALREKEKALESGNQTKVAEYQKAVEAFNAKKVGACS